MNRKLLFVIFSEDTCRLFHAFSWAIELHNAGHQVRLLLEGEGVLCLRETEQRFAGLLSQAQTLGLFAGACKTASCGCGGNERDVTALAVERGIPLLDSLQGHAGISQFVAEGYELVTF